MVFLVKELALSTCEKFFIIKAFEEKVRLDGRRFDEYRPLRIKYGVEWGNCFTSLGNTKVLAQVTCEITQPKVTRPNEGLLFINVDLGQLGSLYFESNRQSEIAVHISRILEKCLQESQCIDLESLCILADEKVWKLRVDLHVLNYDGNLISCCSVAALAALKHFKYPEVTIKDGLLTIHSINERNPLPLTVRHFPVVLSYVLFRNSDIVIEDPTLNEEKVADTILFLFLNSYDEFCGMHLEGAVISNSDIILSCSKSGGKKVKQIVDLIKTSVAEDAEKRKSEPDKFNGLVKSIALNSTFARAQKVLQIQLSSDNIKTQINKIVKSEPSLIKMDMDEDSGSIYTESDTDNEINMNIKKPKQTQTVTIKQEKMAIIPLAKASAELININSEEEDDNSTDDNNDVELIDVIDKFANIDKIELSGDSEEEDTTILQAKSLQ